MEIITLDEAQELILKSGNHKMHGVKQDNLKIGDEWFGSFWDLVNAYAPSFGMEEYEMFDWLNKPEFKLVLDVQSSKLALLY